MSKQKITRFVCAVLAVFCLVSSVPLMLSAEETASNLTEKSIATYRDALNTVSYDEYVEKNASYFKSKTTATFVSATQWVFRSNDGAVFRMGYQQDEAGEWKDAPGVWTMTTGGGIVYKNVAEAELAGIDPVYVEFVNGYMNEFNPTFLKADSEVTHDILGNWTFRAGQEYTVKCDDGAVSVTGPDGKAMTGFDQSTMDKIKAYAEKYYDYFPLTKASATFDASTGWTYTNQKGDTMEKVGDKWVMTTWLVSKVDGKTIHTADRVYESTDGFRFVNTEDPTDVRQYTANDEIAFLSSFGEGTSAKNGLYTPSVGTVSWKLDFGAQGITESGLYNISLLYYPVVGKPASVERQFAINSETPFSEARALTLPKVYSCLDSEGKLVTATYKLRKKDNADTIVAKAAEVGLRVVSRDSDSITFEQPVVVTSAINEFIGEYTPGLRFFVIDANRNELRPTMTQTPSWKTYTFHDSDGYYADDFGFVLSPDADGTVTVSLSGVNEPMALAEIVLTPYEATESYEDYRAYVEANVSADENVSGTDYVKLEAEYTNNTSTNVIYAVEDRASALTSPCDTTRTLLNTVGTEKWETAGQWVEYKFKVNSTGWYDICSRFKQSYLDGMYVSRSMQIFTEGTYDSFTNRYHSGAGYYDGTPFAEAAELRYEYSTGWQSTKLKNDEEHTYEVFFRADVEYTIRLEVTLGSMSERVRQIESILTNLNNDYLSIIKLTGTSPDDYRDYSFSRLLPLTLQDMLLEAQALDDISSYLKNTANVASTYTGICDKLSTLLRKMATDEDNLAKNLDNFKSYVGSLGTFLTDAKTQPLQLDYLTVQPTSAKLPKASPNIFVSFWHEIQSFVQSFFRDYNSMGAMDKGENSASVNVWLAYGRDQAQVIRSLCTNDFTPNSSVSVDLKLVSGSTLLPSILAGMGPDVYLGLAQATVINYAIRGALMDLRGMEGFDEVRNSDVFNDAAWTVLEIGDIEDETKVNPDGTVSFTGNKVMHTYGLPETQGFPMMFVRLDILADLDIEIPRTWDEVYKAQAKLESNNMEIGMTTSYKMFLYQMGGDLWADDGMRINLDSSIGLKSFEKMCNMFTQYSFPYSYDAANRFRTGEMPIIVADYTALYNKLKVFATELDGAWTFVPLPADDETGKNDSISGITAVVIINGIGEDQQKYAWEFSQWYTGSDCQQEYANQMVAIIGDSAKHSTANHDALASMPWTHEEYVEVEKQFNNLASVENYPGFYYIDRYTEFAFLSAYNDDADPTTELLSYINTINNEITRKRQEFHLETLEIGETLASKRMDQALTALAELQKRTGDFDESVNLAKLGIANKKIAQLEELSVFFESAYKKLYNGTDTYSYEYEYLDNNGKNRTDFKDVPLWYVNVGKQTAENRNGGYKIESLSDMQLFYFISKCLSDSARALATY